MTKQQRIDNVLDAIEAFVTEKIAYDRMMRDDPEWANSHVVSEMREHLRDKLAEALR